MSEVIEDAVETPQEVAINYLTVYDPATGKILETHYSPGQIQLADKTKVFVSKEADIKTQYILGEDVVDRPTFGATLVGNILKGVPSGATVTIDGTDYEADGTDIELSFSIDAAHKITVSMWPYLPEDLVYEDQP